MSGPLFTMVNTHGPDAGRPPDLHNDSPRGYCGYFENAYGEQWVFTFDRKTKLAELRGGDAGWANAFPVIAGEATGVILGPVERQWLLACWAAATGERSTPANSLEP